MSGRKIPQDIRVFLSLGFKFSLQPWTRDINISKLLSEIDPAVNKVNSLNRDVILASVTNVITNYMHNNRSFSYALINVVKKVKCFLKDNRDILVLRSDTNNCTTLVTKETYINKYKIGRYKQWYHKKSSVVHKI